MAKRDETPQFRPEDIAISVQHVSKNFALPHERVGSLKHGFTRLLKPGRRTIEVQHALRDISFDIGKGEFFGIVGRNGSGKSTLLKILAGIYQPTKGRVRLQGKLVPFIELGVGFNPELTGRENVYLNGALLGFSKKEMDEQYGQIVKFSELEEFMDQKLKNYSSGMQVRLAFSVAIIAQADILLVDEVLAVGDAAFQRKCFNYFRELKKKKQTVVFVSHDMDAVRRFCDRAVLIEDSRLIMSGGAEKIADAYTKIFLEEARNEAERSRSGIMEKTRWGDEAARYGKVRVKVGGDVVTLTAEVTAKHALEEPVFGHLVKNSDGLVLFGNNTKNMKLTRLTPRGLNYEVEWTFPNLFNEGTYGVDLAISYNDGVTADWWQDAAEIKVVRDRNTPFAVHPDTQFSLREQE